MRKLTYAITFIIIAASAALFTAHYVLLFARVHLLGMLRGWGLPVYVFGALPFPTQPDPSPYVAIATSAPLLILALRRLLIFARTGSLTPVEFRGFAYVVGMLGIVVVLVAAGSFAVTRSMVISLLVLQPASWLLFLSFVLAELTGPLKARPAAKWIGVATGVLLLAVFFLPWDRYVAKWAYQRLCATRAGEKVYAPVRAQGYLLVGEAPGEGVGVQTAVNDVLERRFAFVEVQRIPHNTSQSNSLNSVFHYRVPAVDFFRVSLGAQGSPGCLPDDRPQVIQAKRKGQLKEGECLVFAPTPQPSSRYKVAVQADAKPVWYTWRVFMQRVSVVDLENGTLLGESSLFERVGGWWEKGARSCPAPDLQARRQLLGFHRKVLLTGAQ